MKYTFDEIINQACDADLASKSPIIRGLFEVEPHGTIDYIASNKQIIDFLTD